MDERSCRHVHLIPHMLYCTAHGIDCVLRDAEVPIPSLVLLGIIYVHHAFIYIVHASMHTSATHTAHTSSYIDICPGINIFNVINAAAFSFIKYRKGIIQRHSM